MIEGKGWIGVRTGDAAKLELARWVAGPRIVIAAHERHLNRRMRASPFVENAQRFRIAAFGGVKEVAEEEQPLGNRAGDDDIETGERAGRRSARHRNSQCPERRRLSKMRIGDEQRFSRAPPDRALRQKCECFPGDTNDGVVHRSTPVGAGPAAFSSESCIRRMRSLSDSDDTLSRFRSTTRGNA